MKHKDLVRNLKKPQEQLLLEAMKDPRKLDAMHFAIGLASDAGELLDCLKKYAIYNQPINKENLIEELGDIEWFLQAIRDLFHISRERTIKANIGKLVARYPNVVYSDKDAKNRQDKATTD